MMRTLFLINGALECIAGLILIFAPQLLLVSGQIDIKEVSLVKLIGIASFFFGLISYAVFKEYNNSSLIRRIAVAFAAYHFLSSLHMYSMYNQGVANSPIPFILNMVISLLFLIAIARKDGGMTNLEQFRNF